MGRVLCAAAGAAALLLTACTTNGAGTVGRTLSMQTTTDVMSVQRGRASFASLAAVGYHYHFTGRLSNINVSSTGGRTAIFAHATEGDQLNVTLEQIPNTIFSLGRERGASSLPFDCADCADGKASTPPHGQATNPPNYGGCNAAGGATWYNEATGEGGCLGPGGSKGFPCGTWSYASPGNGRFRSWDGTVDADGWTFISLNPDGQSCHLGY